MSTLLRALVGIVWPPAAPVLEGDFALDRREQVWWALLCILLVIPFTAVWHHAVFYPRHCILKDFGPDYAADMVAQWLSRDPSLPWAMLTSAVLYAGGRRSRRIRLLAAPLFVATLPLSIWIWDIPFTGGWVCRTGHNGNRLPVLNVVIRTRYLYLLAAMLQVVLLVATLARRSPGRSESSPELI